MPSPILLVPGLNCTAEIFAPQIPALWPEGSVTIANTTTGNSIAAIAASILEQAPPNFALGGISLGGYIAFEIIRQAPERVLRLALIDTSARPDSAAQTAIRKARIVRAEAGEFETVVAEQFPQTVHPSHAGDARLRDLHQRMGLAIGPQTYIRQQRAIIARPDARAVLASIAVPTMVIVGEADQVTPIEHAREMAAGIAASKLVVIPHCGHLSTQEQPDAVNAALVEWLG